MKPVLHRLARRAAPIRSRGALIAAAVLCAVPAAVPAQETADATVDAAREVEAREIAFARTMADRDFEAFLTFLSDEAVFFAGDRPIRGPEAIGGAWRSFYDGEAAPFSWHPEVVEVLDSGDLAISSGPVRDPSGEVVGRFTSIWRRDADGVWRVVFDKGCP